MPFRLTREIIDPMGITGVNGLFTFYCQRIMELMKESKVYIETILEAFLSTPPKKWSDEGFDANIRRGNRNVIDVDKQCNTDKVKLAESILIRCRDRLNGVVDGNILSVESQVAYVIDKSKDRNNLSKMYSGWSSWC